MAAGTGLQVNRVGLPVNRVPRPRVGAPPFAVAAPDVAAAGSPALARDALSALEAFGQSLAATGPSIAITGTIPVVYLEAGNGTVYAVILGTVIVLLFGTSACRSPSSGASTQPQVDRRVDRHPSTPGTIVMGARYPCSAQTWAD